MKEYLLIPKTLFEKMNKSFTDNNTQLSQLTNDKTLNPEIQLSLMNSYLKNENSISTKQNLQNPVHSLNENKTSLVNNIKNDIKMVKSNPSLIKNDYKSNLKRNNPSLNESLFNNDSFHSVDNDIQEELSNSNITQSSFDETLKQTSPNASPNKDISSMIAILYRMLGDKIYTNEHLTSTLVKLIEEGVITISEQFILTFKETNNSIPGFIFINSILRKNGSISSSTPFLLNIRRYIPNDVILNYKFLSINQKQTSTKGSLNFHKGGGSHKRGKGDRMLINSKYKKLSSSIFI